MSALVLRLDAGRERAGYVEELAGQYAHLRWQDGRRTRILAARLRPAHAFTSSTKRRGVWKADKAAELLELLGPAEPSTSGVAAFQWLERYRPFNPDTVARLNGRRGWYALELAGFTGDAERLTVFGPVRFVPEARAWFPKGGACRFEIERAAVRGVQLRLFADAEYRALAS